MHTIFEPEHTTHESTEAIEPVPPSPLSPYIEKFLHAREKNAALFYKGETTTIKVSEVLGSLAHLYERVRNIIEYKGEHVLRRNAIERIIKRLLWERASHDTGRIAQILLRELIWARYLPNDAIPKHKSTEVSHIISKYLYLLGALTERGVSVSKDDLRNWAWGIASCEIEECLDPTNREPYVTLMYDWFVHHFRWTDDAFTDHEKQIQIYLAIHRGLTKSDDQIMRYHLLVKEFPEWAQAQKSTVDGLVEQFFRVYQEIEKHLNFPDRFGLYRLVQRQVAPFEVLKELVHKEDGKITQVLANPDLTEQKVREICHIRYRQIQQKVNRGIIRSIIYIFATKVLLALLIEVPYELTTLGHLTWLPLGINVVVPPTMMFLIGLTIKAPGESNTQRIVKRLKTIVYPQPNIAPAPFSLMRIKRGALLGNVFAVIYGALFLLVFGAITYLLAQLGFTIVGMAIFFIFLSLVILFGFRVRFTAQELKMTGESENIFGYLFSNITLPFLKTGMFLSQGLRKLNFFTIILDFLIEAPLKTVIEVVEEWTSFIREKREEMVEVPE